MLYSGNLPAFCIIFSRRTPGCALLACPENGKVSRGRRRMTEHMLICAPVKRLKRHAPGAHGGKATGAQLQPFAHYPLYAGVIRVIIKWEVCGMKKYAVPVVCLLLAVSVSYFIYSNVISNLYKRQYIDSLISEIFIKVSDTQESLLELIERGEGTMDDMKYVCANFDSLSILAGSGYGINNSAESYFHYIGATFIGNGSTSPCSTRGIYEDKMITDNEVQYMNRLVDILNKTVENVYNEKNGAYDINTLNDNLRAVDRLLKDPENSPYLLIRYDP